MDHATQVEVVERWLAMYRAGGTQMAPDVARIDPSIYTSPEWFDAEQRTAFRARPVVACLSADIATPGDFVTFVSGGVPLVVVRDDDGVVRAFHNACRHRGTQVAHGCGHSKNFACPFHNWTYARDGRLLGQPRSMGGFDSLDKSLFGLVPVTAGEGHGLVFVQVEATPAPVADDLEAEDRDASGPGTATPLDVTAILGQEIARDLDALDLSACHVWGRERRSWDCNWKLLLDTFTESYHVFALHGASVGPDYPGHIMAYDAFGPHLRIPVPRLTILELEDQPQDDWDLLAHATVQYHLSPNAMVKHTIDHFILWRFEPVGPGRTVAEMTMYTREPRSAYVEGSPAHDAMVGWFDLHDAVTRDEDYPESERIQRTLESGVVRQTVLGRNEGATQHFHRIVREAVASAASISEAIASRSLEQ